MEVIYVTYLQRHLRASVQFSLSSFLPLQARFQMVGFLSTWILKWYKLKLEPPIKHDGHVEWVRNKTLMLEPLWVGGFHQSQNSCLYSSDRESLNNSDSQTY